jgi:hypothetical protein
MTDIIRAIIELSRGHSESRMKSLRNGEAWEERRESARRGECVLTRKLPAWVEQRDGVLTLVPDRAASVRRIFTLAARGLGGGLIVQSLKREKRPPFGPSGLWSRAYVALILKDRRAVGEFQPRYRNGRPAGEAIPSYFPPCVTEAEWAAARLAVGKRGRPRGRPGEYVNLFTGLLRNAREGDSYYVTTRTNNGKHRRVLIAGKAMENGSRVYGFDAEIFERAILSLLREVDPRAVLGNAPGQDEVILLAGELAHVEAQQEAIQQELLKGDVAALARAARALDAREKELKERLSAARLAAAHPAAESWGEAMSIIDVLGRSPDPRDARLRLRCLLRDRISEIWLLVVPVSETRRFCVAQVYFAADGHRDFLIYSQSAGHRRKGGWWCRTLPPEITRGLDLDLKTPGHVRDLVRVLQEIDTGLLAAAMRTDDV